MDQLTHEAEIRRRIQSWADAIRAKDFEGVMSHYAESILSFDLAPPLEYKGADYKRGWEEWLRTFAGPIGYEIRNLSITSTSDLAFSSSLNRISGRRTSGEETDVWVRATLCLRKVNGQWMIIHEHLSVPFNMEPPYTAALTLVP